MRRDAMKLMFLCVLALFCATHTLAAEETTVRGRLSRTVEPGGWLILSAKEKYLLLNAASWQSESWFRVDAEVEASGEVKRGTITTFQEGVPFQASSLRQINSGDEMAQQQQQITGGSGTTRVIVSGEGVVRARPDTANITVAVITQAGAAIEAQQANANRSDAVVRAVKAAAGTGAEVQTSGYSLQPQYAYAPNQQPTIKGYEARNGVNVMLNDLTKVGAVIDAAASAGANNVDSLSFILRNDLQARSQALTIATREALSKAQVIASALGGHVVRVVEVQEGGALPRPIYDLPINGRATAGKLEMVQTPVEVGNLDIRTQVQLIVEVMSGH